MNDTIFSPGAYSPSGQVRSHIYRTAHVDPPCLHPPREPVQRVALGHVVEVVRAGEPEGEQRIAVRDEAAGAGRAV